MSSETADAPALQVEDVAAVAERYGHLALVGLLMVFMLWVRLINFSVFRRDDGGIHLSAIDSWYHQRATEWTTQNYPWTMPYEIYTGFPTGRYVGQFGTLFDQIVATVAMIIGLGDPSQTDVQLAAMIVVPVLAALVAIPVYLVAKKVADGNRFAGLVAVVFLALTPGEFLRRSTAGQFQHHVAEVLFMALALLAIVVALRVAEREKPIWELVEAKEWEPLKEPAKYSALAGVALSLYLWTWPPAVMFVGILGFFFAIHLCIEFLRGTSPDHVAFVGAISMGVPALFMLVMLEEWSTSVTSFGLIQPAVAIMVAVGCVFMAWLAREWDARQIERSYYPAAIVGLGVAGLLAMMVLLPDIFSTIVDNVTRRILPIGASETDATIQEASPSADFVARATREFGMGLYLLIIGLVLVAARPFIGQRYRAEHTLILVWSLFLVSMAMTQVRFWYYFILPVAILSGYTIGQALGWLDLQRTTKLEDLQGYQILAIVLVLTVLFVPFAPMVNDVNAVNMGQAAGPSNDAIVWEGSNQFMAENTPEPGNLYGAGYEEEMDYYGSYDYPEDGDFDYPEGAYGVMSWWDYGHLITTQAERIPHSNPFQQNARSSSAYLQAPSEEAGNGALDLIAEGESPRLDETGALTQQPPESVESGEEIPYVMIDYQMAGSKFPAITQWTGPDASTYWESQPVEFQGEEQGLPAFSDAYYDTQLASLYIEDADGMENYRLVHESDIYAYVGGELTQDGPTPFGSDIVGFGWEQAQMYDGMIQQADAEGTMTADNRWGGHVVSAVKTYERVDGATLSGSTTADVAGDANVTVELDLETEPGRTFTYTQATELGEDGSFELTVPYATTEELGADDGYTESTVTANGSYEVLIEDGENYYLAEVDVEEPAIYDGETIPVEDFEEVDPDELEDDEGEEADEGDEAGDDDETDTEDDETDNDEDDETADGDGADTEDDS